MHFKYMHQNSKIINRVSWLHNFFCKIHSITLITFHTLLWLQSFLNNVPMTWISILGDRQLANIETARLPKNFWQDFQRKMKLSYADLPSPEIRKQKLHKSFNSRGNASKTMPNFATVCCPSLNHMNSFPFY